MIEVDSGNAWVPDGASAWEFSSEKGPKSKATADYEKRTADPKGVNVSDATFMFVTPHKWKGKFDWARGQSEDGEWACVRALDADDLVAWLEQAPEVAVWFAQLIGRLPPFVQELHSIANHQTDLHTETRYEISEHINTGFVDLKSDLQSLFAQAMASMPQSAPGDAALDPATEALKEKVDLTRDFINHGFVRKARVELERLTCESESIPYDLRFRMLTNLGACYLAEGDMQKGSHLLDEAYKLQPTNQLAIANAAWAAHLRKEPERARALALEARELDLKHSQATAVLIEAFWESGARNELDVLLAAEPWIAVDQRCGLILARIRLQQHEFEEAIGICRSLISAETENARFHLVLSKCLLEHAQSDRLPPEHEKGSNELLREAENEATRAIEILQMTELRMLHQEALVTRAAIDAEPGAFEKAMVDLDQVLGETPAHSEASFVKGQILLQCDRPHEARSAFEAIQDLEVRAGALLPLAVSCLVSGDEATAIKLLKGTITFKSLDWEEIRGAEILSRAERTANEEDSLGPGFAAALRQHPANTLLQTLKAVRLDILGDPEGAEILFLKVLEHADESDHKHVLIRLATLYHRQNRYTEAADRFSEVVNGNVFHPAAIPLLGCLVNSKRLGEALSWALNIRTAHPEPPRTAIDVEAQILELVGDLSAAIQCRTKLCSREDATANDRAGLALPMFRLGQFDAALEVIHQISPGDLSNNPQLILAIAQMKRIVGEDDYLEYAHADRRFGLNDPVIQLGYFQLFLGRGKEWLEPDIVGSDCAVLLKNETTEQWWQLLGSGEEYGGPYDLQMSDKLAQRLLGRRIGETIVLQQGLEELSYEIAAIQSKFLRAWQVTIAEFSTRFPESKDLLRVKIEGDDLTKVLFTLDQRDQLVQRAELAYREGRLPFSSFADLLGRSVPEVWRACTTSDSSRICFGNGTTNEEKETSRTLAEAEGIVLELLGLLTVYQLQFAQDLRNRFSYIAVPQLVIDYLHSVYAKAVMDPPPTSWLGKGPNGEYTLCEMSEEYWLEWKKYVQTLFEFAISFDRIASHRALDVDDMEMLEDVLTTGGMAAIYAGDESSNAKLILVSDDMVLSSLTRSKNTAVANTQGLLKELRRTGVITDKVYSLRVEQLALLNYWFVQVLPGDIIRRLVANSYITTEGTHALFRTLEGPDCSDDSALSVGTSVVAALAECVPSHQMDLILSLVVSTLRHGRKARPILYKFRNELASRLTLAPFIRDQVLQAVDGYIHFMDKYVQSSWVR